ncbi:LysR family transcriptional regulator [Pseudomonas putida]|uniref:LysR family transcriptional regulator n=3 Tax=Pseudomonas putida TaxID=303 RepID=UPI001E2DA40C|nr:LysR family transcriptional regulator [Pseudomonas putida]MCE0961185.1 LysR family transcriptional regulator [Pseudomonas putida]MCE0972922.1 LysR family transcriptional regulator [Pseudomonas putida]MDD2121531.1 LysR family transcriptional regulator [Pseudomonas putida]UPU95272.1 LysR family transcriptional regulator [Pseudomonas putida]HDS1731555.1 LysR family transcriptional regulator [Pseudomonas putida]
MKIDDMDAFVAVIRCQSTNLAAEALQLTQPAITRRVQNFEEDLGATLLDRNTKPLKPTPMGLRVYEQCKAILREIDSLRELVANDGAPSGTLRLGVPQTLGDVVLLDALAQIRKTYPDLRTQVTSGWGSSLIARMENGELDAAAALFPPGKIFPEGIASQSIARMPLRVVAAKGSTGKRSLKLKDCYTRGWVLNPDGCGFRAGLQRALSEQGLRLSINLETFGTELQLGLVANGQGLGLVPEPLLQNSRHRDALDVVSVTDFKPQVDLWLFHPRYLGNLQEPVELFGRVAGQQLCGVS